MTEPAAAQAAPEPAAPAAVPPPAPVPQPSPAQPAAAAVDEVAKLRADLAAAEQRAADWQSQARKHEDRSKGNKDQLDRQDQVLRMLAEKMGVQIDDKPDPAKVAAQAAAQAAQWQAEARQASTELAVHRAAQAAGANATALIDSRSFMARTASLDPTAPEFAEQVRGIVAEHVAANPSLATPAAPAPQGQPAAGQPAAPGTPAQPASPLPSSSGPVVTAPPTTGQQWTQADVDAATPEQLSRAIDQGLLVEYGIGRPRRGRNQ